MEIITIYSLRMAQHLIRLGFIPIGTTKHYKNPNWRAFLFEESDALHEGMSKLPPKHRIY